MFQPQPTPFAFSAYGVRDELPDYSSAFHQSPLGLSGPRSGGGGPLPGQGPQPGAPATSGAPGPAPSSGRDAAPPPPPLLFSTTPAFTGTSHSSFSSSSNHAPPPPSQRQPRQQPTLPSHLKMEPNPAATSSSAAAAAADDLAAQEAAAREYQPEREGPLVGEKIPSHAIAEQFATADPTYVAKTLALARAYAHYRSIQGDGNCGWRAIGFCYFECLIKTGDRAKLNAELQRILQLDDYLTNAGGYNPYIFEDMVEETRILFRELMEVVDHKEAAIAALTQKFNDRDSSNAIIYHLRLLAASWLKGNAELYQDFVHGDGGISGYCNEWIEAPDREIDHLGITLLCSILLKPAGLMLEIAYLDRSEGDQVNTYRFLDDANSQEATDTGRVIYLLYRPDHYDIIYRPEPQAPVSIQVNRATSFSHGLNIASNTPSLASFAAAVDLSPLSMLPGAFGGAPAGLSGLIAPIASPLGEPFAPSPQSSWMAQPSYADAYSSPEHEATPTPPAAQPPPPPPPTSSAATADSIVAGGPTRNPLRFTKWQYPQLMENAPLLEPTFTTQTFKNSHFNKAHYNNPNFQPEEYKPDGD